MPRKLKSSTEAPLAPIPAEILDQFVRQGPMTRARGAHVENRDEPVRDPLRGPLHGAERVECLRPKNAWTLIGIGGHLAMSPLPHHRAYGSVPRRFGRLSGHDVPR